MSSSRIDSAEPATEHDLAGGLRRRDRRGRRPPGRSCSGRPALRVDRRRARRARSRRPAPADPRGQRRAAATAPGSAARRRRALRLPGRDDAKGQGRVPRESSARRSACSASVVTARRAATSMRGVDVVIAIGTSLGDMATDGFSRCCRLARARPRRHRRAPNRQELRADARDRRVRRRAARWSRRAPRGDFTAEAARAARGRRAPRAAGVDASPTASRRTKRSTSCRRCCRKDTIYTVDSGEHFLFAVALPRDHAARRVRRDDGPRLDGPVDRRRDRRAARASRPHRRRDLGDGCFAMNAFEIATAVAEQPSDPRVRVQRRAPRHGRERPRDGVRPPPPSTRRARSTSARSRAASARSRCASTASVSSPGRRHAARARARSYRRPHRPRHRAPVAGSRVGDGARRRRPTPATPHLRVIN